MRCLFCKQTSDDSKSVEHIIPESIGNTKYTLSKGVVCDSCNNYFSRKVEGPLLSHVSFRNLRAWYQIPTKKGVMPRLHGFIAGTDIDVGLRLGRQGQIDIEPERESDRLNFHKRLQSDADGVEPNIYVFCRDFDPPRDLMSRFLAKMALESLALRFSSDPNSLTRLVEDIHYDKIRNRARKGRNSENWPYHYRQLFPEETLMRHPATREWVQAGYGFDLLLTPRPETYFIFCLYGHEFAINLGGPSVRGYKEWLAENGNISPIVERVGLRLKQRNEDGKQKFFLEGIASPAAGAKFDHERLKSR